MQSRDGRIFLSPSDLNDHVECPHLTTLALEVARGERARPQRLGDIKPVLSRSQHRVRASLLTPSSRTGWNYDGVVLGGEWILGAGKSSVHVSFGGSLDCGVISDTLLVIAMVRRGRAMRVLLSAFFLLLAAPTISQSAQPGSFEATFDPSGYFIPVQSEKNASKIRWILLSNYHGPDKTGPLHVELRIGTERKWTTWRQESLDVRGNTIRFRTKVQNGVRYEFDGQFLPSAREKQLGQFGRSATNGVTLRGVLTKVSRNKVLLSEELSFFYTAGD